MAGAQSQVVFMDITHYVKYGLLYAMISDNFFVSLSQNLGKGIT